MMSEDDKRARRARREMNAEEMRRFTAKAILEKAIIRHAQNFVYAESPQNKERLVRIVNEYDGFLKKNGMDFADLFNRDDLSS